MRFPSEEGVHNPGSGFFFPQSLIHDWIFRCLHPECPLSPVLLGEKGTALLKVIDSCNEVCLKVISTVMYFTPIGVFCTIVPVVEANGTETIISLATQLIILYFVLYKNYHQQPIFHQ